MKALVIDVGGTHVNVLVSGEREPRKFESGATLTARQMVAGVKKIIGDWKYDVVSRASQGRCCETDLLRTMQSGRGMG